MHSGQTSQLCCRLQQLRWRRRCLPLIHSLLSLSLHMPARLRHLPPPLRHRPLPLRHHWPPLRHRLPPLRASAHNCLEAHTPFPSLSPTSRKHQQMDSVQIALRQMCLLPSSLNRCQKSLKLPTGRLMNQPAVMRHHQKLPKQLQCMKKTHLRKVVWDYVIQQLTKVNPPLLPPAVLDQILIANLRRRCRADLLHRLQHSHHRHP